MQILAIILGLIVIAIIAILAIAATKPGSFTVQRSADVDAAPDAIFALVNDFRQWREWSPYEAKDPELKRTLSGADAGQGSVYEWSGNNNVGTGRMEITDATAPNKVVIKLDFMKPFEAHNIAEFTMEPQGATSRVTWAMRGPAPFITKVMQTVMNFDKMIGKDFEQGLANLKAIAERKRLASS